MNTKFHQSNFANDNCNPCIKESDLVNKCLETNLYDYPKCSAYFENYRICKKFWGNVAKERKSLGIEPAVPSKEERDKILNLRKKGIKVVEACE